MSIQIQLPLDPPHPARPQRNLRELQATAPVHRVRTAVGDPAWMVTGYQEVRRLLSDPRLGRRVAPGSLTPGLPQNGA
jgi:cytochrome P450